MPIRWSVLFVMLFGHLWLVLLSASAATEFPASFPGNWSTFGRAVLKSSGNSIVIANGTAFSDPALNDYEFSFRARAPQEAGQVQLWAAVRLKNRDCRYVVGLRGGPEKQLSLARYAPDGQSKFLGWVPLEFTPECATWYTLRIAVHDHRFHVYLNDEKLPRINIEDTDANWMTGGVGLGGGWLPA
ncbi:MAG TPA: hypothetical protein VKC60_01075, partial [Opitutaceae bacterium]|nr:hypothetical protein [Opitutaceae bacterium]